MAKKRRRRLKKVNKSNHFYSQRLKDRHIYDVLRDEEYSWNIDKPLKIKDQRLISLKRSIIMARSRESITQRPIRDVKKILQIPINDAILNRKEVVCRERKEKRRSLFRTGKAGKGVAGPIRRVINLKSKVRCR